MPVLDLHGIGAAAAAEGAGHFGACHLPGPGLVLEGLVDERPHRADVHAGAAKFAIERQKARPQLGVVAPVHEIDGHGPHVVPADAHAAAAGNAAVGVALDELRGVVDVGGELNWPHNPRRRRPGRG